MTEKKESGRFSQKDIIGAVCALVGFSIGLICSFQFSYFIGLCFVIAAAFIMKEANYSNEPKAGLLEKDLVWEKITDDKAEEIFRKINKCRKECSFSMSFISYVKICAGVLFVLAFIFFGCNIDRYISAGMFFGAVIYIMIICYAKLCTGGKDYYYSEKLYYALGQQKNLNVPEGWSSEQSVQIAKQVNIPMDLKAFLKPNDCFGGFMGIQVQTGINNGPNGQCPYTYCVILADKKFGLIDKFNKCREEIKEFAVNTVISDETKPNDTVSVIVVRKDGYSTTEKEAEKLTEISVKSGSLMLRL
ncbi:MAG: hypothetical protein KBT47_06550 [Armatimonadetes bacterium]|nr:hypothetical protein [Candidatus Hippobium faecium]